MRPETKLTPRDIVKMLETKCCPRCMGWVEYHYEENNWMCPFTGNEELLIHHFNLYEIAMETRG